MTIETFLEEKLRKFSIIDFACVKSVYFFISLLTFSLYQPLSGLGWLFLAILCLLCNLPLWVHFSSLKGSFMEKVHAYLKTNNPANQVLVFLSVFFFALMLGILCPFLVSFNWWVYLALAVIFAIKPLTVTWFW